MKITRKILDESEEICEAGKEYEPFAARASEPMYLTSAEKTLFYHSRRMLPAMHELVREMYEFTTGLAQIHPSRCVFCTPRNPSLTEGYVHEDGCVVNKARRLVERMEEEK